MKLIAIYRIYPGENYKNRPPYYNKLLTLKSFLAAFDALKEKKLIVAVDSKKTGEEYVQLCERYTDNIVYLGGLGNAKSYLETLKWINTYNDENFIYYSEDDYLYQANAFIELEYAVNKLKDVDYFSLYDHPDRYTRADDKNKGKNKIYIAGNYHWRTIESTCMTFGARIKAFKEDIHIHKRGATKWFRPHPHDRYIWRKTQGIGKYFWKFPKRKLVSPIPSLATHMETTFLSPNINWEEVSKKILKNQ